MASSLGFLGLKTRGQRSKDVITNLLNLFQNPDFIDELRLKLEMVRSIKSGVFLKS